MSTLQMDPKTTLPSINILNNSSSSFRETTIVTAVALAFVILALTVFLGILLVWKVQCRRCPNRQSEENPQQFTEVYIGGFVPHTVPEDDHTASAASYVNTAATGVDTSQINCTMTDKTTDNHSTIRGKLQHNNLNDDINDNIIYQEVESNNVYSEAGSFDVYTEAGPLNVYPEAEPLNVYTEAGPLNVYTEAGPLNVYPEAEPLNVYTEAGPLNVYPEAEPLNVYTETRPFNVYPEAGPLNVYTETGPLNVNSDVELNILQQDAEHSNINPYINIEGYSKARIADTEDADSQLTIDSDNNDDHGNIYVNSNKAMESSSSELFPQTSGDCEDPDTSVYDVPPNNSLYRTSFA